MSPLNYDRQPPANCIDQVLDVQPITASVLAIVDEMASLMAVFEAAIRVVADPDVPRIASIAELQRRIEEADL